MRRCLTRAVVTLIVSWLAGPALAADPASQPAAPALPEAALPIPVSNFGAPVLARGQEAAPQDTGNTGHFIGGAGAYILKPFIELDCAHGKKVPYLGAALPNNEDPGNFQGQSVVEFSHGYEGAPRVWLGYVSEYGLGVRARYFRYEETGNAPPGTLTVDELGRGFSLRPAAPLGATVLSDETNLLIAGFGTDVVAVSERLVMDVWDLEATDEIRAGPWLVTLAVGIRHGDLRAFFDASRFNVLDPAGSAHVLHSSDRFTGTGPSFAVDGRLPLGATGLAAYGNLRGAFLFGTRREFSFARANEIPGADASGDLGSSNSQKDEFLPTAEGEIGVEWSANLGSFRPLIQVGVFEQTWFDALTHNTPGSEPGFSHASPVADNGMLSLFGFTVTAGVSF